MTPAAPEFSDRLAVSLTLTIGGTAHAIAGGAVVHLDLDLTLHGFTGTVEFLVQDDAAHGGGFTDELIADFLGPDLTEVAVEVSRVHFTPETSDAVGPIRASGIAVHKSVSEIVFRRTADLPILVRRYRVEFVDPARALWTRHFPIELYTDKSLEDVFDAHKGDKIALTYDWGVLAEVRPLVFVHLPFERGASFYDFALWLAHDKGGVLTYDHAGGGYKLSGAKDASGTPLALFGDDIAHAELVIPDIPRHQPVVLDSYADGPRTEPIEQAQAATGIRRDVLISSPIAQAVDDAVALEKARTIVGLYEAQLAFGRAPSVDLVPGALVELQAANRWSGESALVGVTWRVRRLRVTATAPPGPLDRDAQLSSTGYTVAVTARLEQRDDARVMLPGFQRPAYPGYVEGKVVSEQGQDGDKTFQTYTNGATSMDEYKVRVPLWADQQVAAPFEPHHGSGNVYIPSYRDERVVLALGLTSASIAKVLEWRAGAPLSMDVQGAQVLLGISDTSNTSINHVYDANAPVFNVARTHDKDTSLIQLREGTLLLQVKETEG